MSEEDVENQNHEASKNVRQSDSVTTPETPVKRKRGRPRKSEVQARINRGKVGRPKGDATILNEYKARMLASPNSRKVLDKVFAVALDDNHKHQAVCMKLVMDRIAPVGAFEQDLRNAKGAGGIQINITGIGGGVSIDGQSTGGSSGADVEAVDGDWEPVDA